MFTCENPIETEKPERKSNDSFSESDSFMDDHLIVEENDYSQE